MYKTTCVMSLFSKTQANNTNRTYRFVALSFRFVPTTTIFLNLIHVTKIRKIITCTTAKSVNGEQLLAEYSVVGLKKNYSLTVVLP
jgi:hypothetical protein